VRRLTLAVGAALLLPATKPAPGAAAPALSRPAIEGVFAADAQAAPYRWSLPRGFPQPAVPADNPMSPAKVALGRRLFFEPSLSVTGQYSCATCHEPSRAFTDGRKVAIGATGQATPTNAMSLTNVAYNVSFGWSTPNIRSLEDQMRQPMLNDHPVEMGLKGREQQVLADLTGRWRSAFTAAFPEARGKFELDHLIKAIATFERTLISGHSPFDEYVFNGKHDALTPQAKRGMALFYSERLGCSSCHSGFNFSGAWRDAQGATAEPTFANNGIGTAPLRVPTLRNVALTAPYMHDGSLSTLEAVLDHYQQAGPPLRRFTLTVTEREEIISFLQSLTDPTFTAEFDGERTHPVSR
jgi:cytochrome c peroxidase